MTAILFDLDDTLINHRQAVTNASEELCAGMMGNREIDIAQFVNHWIAANSSWYQKFYSAETATREQPFEMLKTFFSAYDLELSNSEAKNLFAGYVNRYVELCQLFNDTLETLESLKSFQVGVVTNGQEDQQKRKLQQCGILSYFEVVVTSKRAGAVKPSQEIFHFACEELRVNPCECLYVGDNLQTDVIAARQAGLTGIWLDRYRSNLAPSHAVEIIHSLLDFPEIVEKHSTG